MYMIEYMKIIHVLAGQGKHIHVYDRRHESIMTLFALAIN